MRIERLPILLICAAALVSGQGAPRRAPGFCLPDSSLQLHDLADYRGKYLVLEFMKTTCPHCAAVADILEQVHQKYGDKIAILSVVNTSEDNPKTVAQFIAGHKIGYTMVYDMGQMEYSYVRTPTADLPHVYVIDPNGFIRSDYGYSLTTRDIFEGKGLLTELDRLVGFSRK